MPWEVQPTSDTPEPIEDPEQDAAIRLVWTGEELAFEPGDAGDADDPVQVQSLAELRDLLDDLKRLTGNQHEDLFRLAEKLRDLVDLPLSELDLLAVHLTFQRLSRAYDQRAARDRAIDTETAATLGDVVEAVPGLTLADPHVQTLIRRQQENRGHRVGEAQIEAEIAVLTSVARDENLFDENVRDVADAATDASADNQMTRTRGIISRNAVVAAGKLALEGASTLAFGLATSWVWVNSEAILAAAAFWGPDFKIWITPIIARANEARLAAGHFADHIIRDE